MPSAVPIAETTPTSPDLEPRAYARAVRRILVVMLAVGLALRLVRAFIPSAIWGDEAMLALNLIARDYQDLTRHLDHGQVAPVLFLWGERFVLLQLGTSEFSMRLLPLLASLGGLLFFYDFARRSLPPTAAALAVGLLAMSTWPVSMAGTLKPYSGDLFWSAFLLALAARWHRRPERIGPLWGLVLVVPIALSASYPAVFVAGGVSLFLLPVAWRSGIGAKCLFLAYNLAMVAAFGLTYLLVGQAQVDPNVGSTGEYMRWYWRNGFPPESLWRTPLWLLEAHTGRAFAYPVGDSNGGSTLTALLFALGIAWCWRNGYRSLLVLCLVPFGLNLIAAVIGKYPYAGCCRLSQHFAPAICLLAGAGWAAVMEWWALRRSERLALVRWAAALLITIGIGGLIAKCLNPDRDNISRFGRNLSVELKNELQPGDRLVVYAHPATDVTTRWYLERFGDQVIWAKPGEPLPAAERLWVIATDLKTPDRQGHRDFLHRQSGWIVGDTVWYATRPDDFRHGKGIWWHCGVTCLTRPHDPRPQPQLNALP